METFSETVMSEYRAWGEKFFSTRFDAMSTELAGIFWKLSIMDMDTDKLNTDGSHSDLFSLVEKRAGYLGLTMSYPAILLVSILCNGNPGIAVMYLSAIRYRCKTGVVNMASIAECFPMGFPDTDYLHKMWDAQKMGGSNLLDMISAKDFE